VGEEATTAATSGGGGEALLLIGGSLGVRETALLLSAGEALLLSAWEALLLSAWEALLLSAGEALLLGAAARVGAPEADWLAVSTLELLLEAAAAPLAEAPGGDELAALVTEGPGDPVMAAVLLSVGPGDTVLAAVLLPGGLEVTVLAAVLLLETLELTELTAVQLAEEPSDTELLALGVAEGEPLLLGVSVCEALPEGVSEGEVLGEVLAVPVSVGVPEREAPEERVAEPDAVWLRVEGGVREGVPLCVGVSAALGEVLTVGAELRVCEVVCELEGSTRAAGRQGSMVPPAAARAAGTLSRLTPAPPFEPQQCSSPAAERAQASLALTATATCAEARMVGTLAMPFA